MNTSSKQLIAFWLHRKGEQWSVKSVQDKGNRDCPNQVRTLSASSSSPLSRRVHKCDSGLQGSSLYHYLSTPSGKYKSAVIVQLGTKIGPELSKVILLFQAREKHIVHVETRICNISGQYQLYLEIESKSADEWTSLRNILETLNGMDIKPREELQMMNICDNIFQDSQQEDNAIVQEEDEEEEDEEEEDEEGKREMTSTSGSEMMAMVWFPRVIGDLDNFQRVFHYGTELDADHPGFKDPNYRKRRKIFSEIAIFYKQGEPIPRIKYTQEEISTWRAVYRNLSNLYDKYACSEFKRNLKELEHYCGYGEDNIPQLQDVNVYLKRKTGFQVRPVAGYLSPRDFLAGLAFRVFHCTQYIRHSSNPLYTPEPDCCHELLGHMPMLADQSFAQFSQEIGLASLGASEEDVKKLAACYFFTVEFGLCVEEGELKIYGAGLLSSAGELKHVMEGIQESKVAISKLSLEEAICTPCMVTSFQERYFYSNSIEDAKTDLRMLAASIKKPFDLRYNPYTQSVEALSTSGKIMDLAKELRGDMFLISNAIKKIQGDRSKDIDISGIIEEFLDVSKGEMTSSSSSSNE